MKLNWMKFNSKSEINFWAILFIIIGTGLFIFGLGHFLFIDNFVKNSVTVEGRIVVSADSETSIIAFITVSGKSVEINSIYANWLADIQGKEKVTVLYNPNMPEKAKVKSFLSLWLLPSIIMLLGLVCIIFGVIDFIRKMKVIKR